MKDQLIGLLVMVALLGVFALVMLIAVHNSL